MFADVVQALAAMLLAGWLGLAAVVVWRGGRWRARWTGRRGRVALLVTGGAAVALFGVQAVLADGIDDAGGGATPLDAAAEAFAVGHRTPALTALATTLDAVGGLVGVTVLAAVAAAVLLGRGRRLEAAVVLSAPVAAGLVGRAKLGYDRARPPAAGHLVAVSESSLPSGHTLDATIVLGVLAVVAVSLLRGPAARAVVVVAAVAGIAVAGACRVYLGVHWATDVLTGWLLGGAWVAFSAAVLLLLGDRGDGPRSAGHRTPSPAAAARRSAAALSAGAERRPAGEPPTHGDTHRDDPHRDTAAA